MIKMIIRIIRRLLGHDPKKKEGGGCNREIEISTHPENTTAMPWHLVVARFEPANKRNSIQRSFVEEILGKPIAEMPTRTPSDEIQILLDCRNLKGSWRKKKYIYEVNFVIVDDLPFAVVFGCADPNVAGRSYSDPFGGAVLLESSRSRSNIRFRKLGEKSLSWSSSSSWSSWTSWASWASSKHPSRRPRSSKRGSTSQPDMTPPEPTDPRTRKSVVAADDMLEAKEFVSHASGKLTTCKSVGGSGAALSARTDVAEQSAAQKSKMALQLGLEIAMSQDIDSSVQRFQDPEIETSTASIYNTYRAAEQEQAAALHLRSAKAGDLKQVMELGKTASMLNTTDHRDFVSKEEDSNGPLWGGAPTVSLITGDNYEKVSSSQAGLPHEPSHFSSMKRCAENVARSVGSDHSRSPTMESDSTISDVEYNSVELGSVGSKRADPSPVPPVSKDKYKVDPYLPKSSPEISGLDQLVDERIGPPATTSNLAVQELMTKSTKSQKQGQKEAGKKSKKPSSKSSSQHRRRVCRYGRPADLISPTLIATGPSDDREVPPDANEEETTWTWDENARAYWLIDSDTQSMIWYDDSDIEHP